MGRKRFAQAVYDQALKHYLEEGMDPDTAQEKAKASVWLAELNRPEVRREQKKLCARRRRQWQAEYWDETRKPVSVWLPPELREKLDGQVKDHINTAGTLTLEQDRSELIVHYLKIGMWYDEREEWEERNKLYRFEQNVSASQSHIQNEREKGTPEDVIREQVKKVMGDKMTLEKIENYRFVILTNQPT